VVKLHIKVRLDKTLNLCYNTVIHYLKENMRDFFDTLLSYVIATVRLFILTLIALLNGLHQIIFNRVEICNLSFHFLPLRKDRENISYINKLNMNNTDLIYPSYAGEEEFDDSDLGDEDGSDN